ncbi:MAG: sulfotransferase-like domain-containing protein [Marinibacterium sp.]
MKIAMWSGPRNLSTALMYAFGARPDCAVTDEPFYAAYLAQSGADHPMRDAILASQPTQAAEVAAMLSGPNPEDKRHWYQKHMTHHMLPGMPLGWMETVTNVFLIRHPARVVASYAKKRQAVDSGDLGFAEQAALFDRVREMGQDPVVIDSADIRANPAGALAALCGAIGMAWDPAMLRWPSGGHAADGVWAAHWYGAVHRSTGFAGAEGDLPALDGGYATLARQGLSTYDRLRAYAVPISASVNGQVVPP